MIFSDPRTVIRSDPRTVIFCYRLLVLIADTLSHLLCARLYNRSGERVRLVSGHVANSMRERDGGGRRERG